MSSHGKFMGWTGRAFFSIWSWLRQFLHQWAEPISKWATTIAIVIAGGWAYYNFDITDFKSSNAEINISTESIPYDKDNLLIAIHIKPSNIGKTPLTISGDGLSLTLKKIPKDAKIGRIDLEKISPSYEVHGIEKKYDGYKLEPNVHFDEIETFVLPKGDTYLIEATMDLGDNWEVGSYNVLSVN